MRTIANDIVTSLIRHLPIIISKIDMTRCDNKIHNSVRITKKIIKRLNKIEYEARKQHDI